MSDEDHNNLEFWGLVENVPDKYLSEIKQGKLKGKFNISPIWRMKRITELCGPRGVGWDYDIREIRVVSGAVGETMAFVVIEGWALYKGQRLHGVSTGGAMLVNNFSSAGLKSNDDGIKSAETDAMGVLFKTWGIGAHIYEGASAETSKYDTSAPDPVKKNPVIKQPTEGVKREIKGLW